jgi:hypothetical protein
MNDGDLMQELDDADAAMAADDCEHHWVSGHEPGHIVYWVKICTICHGVDWDDLDGEIRKAVAERLDADTASLPNRPTED